MCGIAGFLGFPVPASDTTALLDRMAAALRHRGPDDQATWSDTAGGVGLAFRRLSIQDLSSLGAQPMHSASGRFVIVYNGEVYNFPGLRSERKARGHHFRGGSDTEVMLAAFEEWGVKNAVPRFTGMLAFAVWDTRDRCLWLCRDRIGVKPLYVGHVGNSLVFASELKALRCIPGFDHTLDRGALALFMRHDYVPSPYSIYASVGKLPPGVLARYEVSAGGRPRETRHAWWSVEHAVANPPVIAGDDAGAIRQLEELLIDSIRMRMIADVPLGILLSGGIDSSTVTALAQSVSASPIKTFTIGFDETKFDEADHARAVAKHVGTQHEELYVSPHDALSIVPLMATIYDEPFGDSSQIPTLLVSRLARRQVTVALSGDGGDELFYGYSRYPTAEAIWKRLGRMPRTIRSLGADLAAALPQSLINAAFARVVSASFDQYGTGGTPSQRLLRLARLAHEPDWPRFYRGVMSRWTEYDGVVARDSEATQLLADPPAWMRSLSPSLYMACADIQTYLADDLMAKIDRASMSVSLELREPLLDHRLAEFALALPLTQKFRNGQMKWLLRQVAYRHIPAALLDRPKQGFEMPVGAWLRGPLRDWVETLLDPRLLADQGFINPGPVRRCWEDHASGRRDFSGKLWNVLMFQSWMDEERRPVVAADVQAAYAWR
jgi:asparagine synthase (glutamine-hydrolysing)